MAQPVHGLGVLADHTHRGVLQVNSVGTYTRKRPQGAACQMTLFCGARVGEGASADSIRPHSHGSMRRREVCRVVPSRTTCAARRARCGAAGDLLQQCALLRLPAWARVRDHSAND
jgi:hypothetical protein